jgi:hypothetical protein
MEIKTRRVLPMIRLFWNRTGSARVYIVAATALLVVLTAMGLTRLFSSVATPKPKSDGPPKATASEPAAVSSPAREPVIAITEIGSTETRQRNGQLNVAVRIGVAPRPKTKKGEVEIRVSFFDVTPSGEMRPTDAQVDYQWVTPVRDWTDPTPKYLVATYLGGATSRKSVENVRYGGFLVRVYFDGQLQAEQSEPKALVTALRSAGPRPSTAPVLTSANVSLAPSGPMTTATRAAEENRTALNQ